MPKYVIGVDVGGTKIRAGLFRNDRLIKALQVKTLAKQGKNKVINKIINVVDLISEGVSKKQIKGIGVGMPGPLDSKKGIIHNPPNLPGWKNVPIKNILRKRTGLKVVVDNDANCLALGVSKTKKCDNLVCLTLGTGVGGGIMINNEIYTGKGSAGELGHIIIKKEGLKCTCGNVGCLEEYVSARAIKRIAKQLKLKVTDPLGVELLAKKNKEAKQVYEQIAIDLAAGIKTINHAFNPDTIALGGGIAKAEHLIKKQLIKELKKDKLMKSPKIIFVKDPNAGVIGAASLLN
ncbi:ROK family protein [Nanoarchaeota archaeon]